METIIEQVYIKRLSSPVQDYKDNAQIWRSMDNGKTFFYCGSGKYFCELWQAIQYKNAVEHRRTK